MNKLFSFFENKKETKKDNFVKSYRFTLEDTIYPNYGIFVNKVSINFTKRTIYLEVLNSITIFENEDIISNKCCINRNLIFTTYNEYGEKLYAYNFKSVFLIDNFTDFDGDDPSVNVYKLTFQYNNKEKI